MIFILWLLCLQAKKEGAKKQNGNAGWFGGWLSWGSKPAATAEDKSVSKYTPYLFKKAAPPAELKYYIVCCIMCYIVFCIVYSILYCTAY